MTETFVGLLLEHGALVIGVVTFLSCLAIPIPASLVMLAAGAFVTAGDLSAVSIFAGAMTGAVIGDQLGFAVGAWGRGWIARVAARGVHSRKLLADAHEFVGKRGGPGVFFSRWLVSPLGPYVNFVAGATGMRWIRFTLWDIAGELVWVSLYLGLGAAFATQIDALGDVLGNLSGALAAGVIAIFLGRRAFRKQINSAS